MAIKKIKVANFKSFRDLEVELGNFNVLIGANASGKSNFVQIFKFLKDCAVSGLENAVSMQGGIEYTQNLKLRKTNASLFTISGNKEFFTELNGTIETVTKDVVPEFDTVEYDFVIDRYDSEIQISRDIIIYRSDNKFIELMKGSDNTITVRQNNIDEVQQQNIDIFKSLFEKSNNFKPSSHIFLFTLPLPFIFFPYRNIFEDISFFDFDPKLPKKATPIAGKADLEEDGSNLSIVLNAIIGIESKKNKLLNIMQDILPFISDLKVEKFADRSLLFTLKERYFDELLPASLISDGTINVTALILALYFDEKPLAIIEEPERNIHPHLMSRIVEMMKDASRNKQIIITTHNPELIKHADLEDILLVSRDSEGFTQITRPSEKEEVRVFLQNEIGLDELFVQNMLEF